MDRPYIYTPLPIGVSHLEFSREVVLEVGEREEIALFCSLCTQ